MVSAQRWPRRCRLVASTCADRHDVQKRMSSILGWTNLSRHLGKSTNCHQAFWRRQRARLYAPSQAATRDAAARERSPRWPQPRPMIAARRRVRRGVGDGPDAIGRARARARARRLLPTVEMVETKERHGWLAFEHHPTRAGSTLRSKTRPWLRPLDCSACADASERSR